MLEAYTMPSVVDIVHRAQTEIEQIVKRPVILQVKDAGFRKPVLSDVMSKKQYNKDQLKSFVQLVTGIQWYQIAGKSRRREIVSARYLYCAFCRTYLNQTLEAIAVEINKHHTTIIHACRTIEDLMETGNRAVIENMERIKNLLYNEVEA